MYTLKEIAAITGSVYLGKNEQRISHYLYDSRDLTSPQGVLFIAIRSPKNDGHSFIPALIERGVRSFLIEKGAFDHSTYADQDISFCECSNTLTALQDLAKLHRKKFNIPVIGITGSNGKTIVKEWLYQLLKKDHVICRSPKSFNSQIGVPLSILALDKSHTLGIFEAGISKPDEMDSLEQIIAPSIGVFTSLGMAHDEGFSGREQKVSEKLKLFRNTAFNIVQDLGTADLNTSLQQRSLLVGEQGGADVSFSLSGSVLRISGKVALEIPIPFNDNASAQNISTCVLLLQHLGVQNSEIVSRIKELQNIALRLELKNGIGNSLIINDFYNSDLDSLRIALNFLRQQSRRNRKVVVVSDIEQSGMLDNQLYRAVADLVSAAGIDLLCGIGKKIGIYRSYFKADSIFFESTSDLIRNFSQISYRFSDSTILLKGARSFGFESISNLLQQKSHDTVFEINLKKLRSNIDHYRILTGPSVKLMCMVKAMGYGGGGSELARTLEHLGVHYLAVAYADEGVELRQSKISLPVMVMSPETDSYDDIIQYHLEPEIYSFRTLKDFISALDHQGISSPYPIHIKIDTGMHRLGFEGKDIDELISLLKGSRQIRVQSVFSHLSASGNPAFDEFTKGQIEQFKIICEKLSGALGYSFIRHICNSGAVTRFNNAHFDMVRLGIGMHGIGVNEQEQSRLQNVGTLKTRISQIKILEPGESTGYNRSGMITNRTRIATIPIGYADGFSRALGNGKFGVYVNGHYCRTVGNICMDMCMVDVTDARCNEGDEVIVFEDTVQLKDMAAAMNTISYEVLTSVSGRVKRVYVWET